MIPIFEQGKGKGIGFTLSNFIPRFNQIVDERGEKAFAFIFYDFIDDEIRKILKDQGAFAKLDRLSGNDLGIFISTAPRGEPLSSSTRTLCKRWA